MQVRHPGLREKQAMPSREAGRPEPFDSTPEQDQTEAPSPTGEAAGHSETPTVILQTGTGLTIRVLAFVGWVGFATCGLLLIGQYAALSDYFDTTDGISEKYHSGAKFGRDKIAVISVNGVIVSGDGYVRRQIDRVRKDKNVKAVVLRVESPGGTVTGADYILHYLKKLRDERKLPIVVSMGSIATSGGYYVSMAVGGQERSIYAEPTTTTGSIGVIIPHYDISGLLERFDVKDDSLMTHPRKDMLSMTKPITEDHRKILQDYLNEAFTRFKSIVKEGRPVFREDASELDKLATGQVFTARQAEANGLIDQIGFIEDAIDRAAELADLDMAKTRVVQYPRPLTLFSLGLIRSEEQPSAWHQVLEGSTPRAYYLWTSLPPLLTTDDR
jgi:protease-4